jgi:choline-sulfatase
MARLNASKPPPEYRLAAQDKAGYGGGLERQMTSELGFGKPFCLFISLVNPHDIHVYPTSWEQVGYCREAFANLGIELPPNYADDLLKKPKVQRAARAGFDKFAPFTSAEAQREYVNCYAYLNTLADKHVMTVLDALETPH